MVVTECSEYLRQDDSNDAADMWTTDNITYENRPRDTENTIYSELDWSTGNLELDLTKFIKEKSRQTLKPSVSILRQQRWMMARLGLQNYTRHATHHRE